MNYFAITLLGVGFLLSHEIEAREYTCSGVARSMATNETTSGEVNAKVIDLGYSIKIDFGSVSYITSKLHPEKPEGKTFPSGATKEGNIIQRRGLGDYRFFQMSQGDVLKLTCK
ncbi:TPA: hypothetical protein ACT0TC_002776 [Klebsiella aerogenes]